jgi:CsoR family transcriptional regulator, copper-sensing transcriptional repressor
MSLNMAHGYDENKDRLIKRLNRIEGQIRGLGKMVADDKYCIDIITQISAARSALDKVAVELVRDHAKHCLSGYDAGKTDEKADELADAISRML